MLSNSLGRTLVETDFKAVFSGAADMLDLSVCVCVRILGQWMVWVQVHGQCETVMTRFRPVPLTWHYCHTLEGNTQLVPLLNEKGTNMSSEMLGKPVKGQAEDDEWFAPNRASRRKRRYAGSAASA